MAKGKAIAIFGIVTIAGVAAVIFSPQNTVSRDETTYTLGSGLYILYLVALAGTFLIPILQKWDLFQAVMNRLRTPLIIIGNLVLVIGTLILVLGLITFDGESWKWKLVPLLGSMVIVQGKSLVQWVKVLPEKKEKYAKAFSITTGFLIGFLFIFSGGNLR